MRRVLVSVIALSLPVLTCADNEHMEHVMEAVSPTEPPIKITINPEARVSVTLAGTLLAPAQCGTVAELPVKIVNQGFVTAPLEVSLVDPMPLGVSVEFSREPLKGIREEHRVLRIALPKKGPVDITVAFRAKNEIPDLGGRDRIHFLMRCLPKT